MPLNPANPSLSSAEAGRAELGMPVTQQRTERAQEKIVVSCWRNSEKTGSRKRGEIGKRGN